MDDLEKRVESLETSELAWRYAVQQLINSYEEIITKLNSFKGAKDYNLQFESHKEHNDNCKKGDV